MEVPYETSSITNVTINIDAVNSELKVIDEYIDELSSLYNNVNPDLTGGWDSATSRTLVSPKIEDIKNSINSIKQSVTNIRSGLSTYSSNVYNADIEGTIRNG